VHGACADFDVERRLEHAAMFRPEVLQAEDEVLKGKARHRARILAWEWGNGEPGVAAGASV
jgi:hypothetical protein